MILGLLFVVASENGCSTARPSIKSLWQQVPPVRWSNKDGQSATAKAEKPAEPAVAANVAIKSDNNHQLDSTETVDLASSRTKPQASRLTTPFGRSEHWLTDGQPSTENSDLPEPNSRPLNEDRVDSPLDRLNAALSDDALQAQSLPQRSVTMLEERFRVDSLLSRANRLIEIGQLQQAREVALLAQETGDAAQLDYSPDEVRPIDLIRRIDGQLEGLADQPVLEEQTKPEQPVAADLVPAANGNDVSSNSPEKELKVLTRKNRNWSAFFRREKKSPAPTAQADGRAREVITLGPAANAHDDSQSVSRSSEFSAPHDAVVMANRSVSLGNTEPASVTSIPLPPDSDEQDSSVEGISSISVQKSPGLELSPARSDRVVSFAVSSDSPRTTFEPDEGTGTLPELEVVENVSPTHEVDSANDESTRPGTADTIEPIRPADGTFFYLTIGVCTILAVVCYRRGAT